MIDLKKQVEEENENVSNTEGELHVQSNEVQDDYFKCKIYNRLEDNFHLSNKKALFWNMSEYYKADGKDPWDALPVTFHIDNGLGDPEYARFLEYYKKLEEVIRKKTLHKSAVLETRKKEEAKRRMRKHIMKAGKIGLKHPTDSESSFSDISDSSASDDEESSDDEFKIPKNMWIVKPGENSNRGNGIQVCSSLQEINNIVRTCRPRKE